MPHARLLRRAAPATLRASSSYDGPGRGAGLAVLLTPDCPARGHRLKLASPSGAPNAMPSPTLTRWPLPRIFGTCEQTGQEQPFSGWPPRSRREAPTANQPEIGEFTDAPAPADCDRGPHEHGARAAPRDEGDPHAGVRARSTQLKGQANACSHRTGQDQARPGG